MKRIFTLVLCFVLAFSLVACNRSPVDSSLSGSDTSSGFSTEGENVNSSDLDPTSGTQSTDTDVTDSTDSTDSENSTQTSSQQGTDDPTEDEEDDEDEEEEDIPYTPGISDLPGDGSGPSGGNSGAPSGGSSGGSSGSSSFIDPDAVIYDSSLEHKFIATDVENHSIVIYDLNKCNGDFSKLNGSSCIIWEWDADYNSAYHWIIGNGLSEAKLRYSEKYKRDVIVACSAGGWVGVIDYNAKTVLWETMAMVGNDGSVGPYSFYSPSTGPHAVEMLPNGDVAVMGSGGYVMYYPLSVSENLYPSSVIRTNDGHGVAWDAHSGSLWVLEYSHVSCVKIMGYGTAAARLEMVSGGDSCKAVGHAFSPMLGTTAHYVFSSSSGVHVFDAENERVEKIPHSAYSEANVKGIVYYEDGTMIQTVGGFNNAEEDWYSAGFRIITMELSTNAYGITMVQPKIQTVSVTNRRFYKVQPLYKGYN